jgi:predicted RNA-binding protein with PIN domain
MNIIIDGYNLLHGAGIVVETGGPYSLEKSRQALLKFLIATLDPHDLARTTVVFDAKGAPPGLPKSYSQAGITVLFADRDQDADTLIARLIGEHSAPKSLLVVSSDHAVQRAARRRKARICDSDRWFASMVRERHAPPPTATDEKPAAPLDADEVAAWVDKFAAELETPCDAPAESPTSQQEPPPATPPASSELDPAKTELEREPFNPFPQGYGEDLLDGET